MDQLRQALLENWNDFMPATVRPRTLYFLQRKRRERVLWYVFSESSDEPLLFAKMMRFRDRNALLAEELARSDAVGRVLVDCQTFQVIPAGKPFLIDGRFILARPFRQGAMMDSRRRVFARNWEAVTKAVLEIQERTRVSREATVAAVRGEYAKYLELTGSRGENGTLERLFDRSQLESLLPWGAMAHCDLGCNNIICQKDRLGILDWEYSAFAQPPLYDIVYFPVHWSYYCQETYVRRWASPDDPTGVINYCFAGRHAFGRTVKARLSELHLQLGLTRDLTFFLLIYSCIRQLNLSLSGIGYRNDAVFFEQLLNAALSAAVRDSARIKISTTK